MRFVKMILAVGLMATCGSAGACLNDSELPDHEREFRSQYLDQQLMTSGEKSSQPGDKAWMMSATGIVLLAGAVGLTWFGRK